MMHFYSIALILCSTSSIWSMLEYVAHPCFFQLPKAMLGVYIKHPHKAHLVGLRSILDGLQNKERPILLDIYVWRMIMHQQISHKTADQILTNLNLLFTNKPMINDCAIDWKQEATNKITLTEELNCGAVREWCKNHLHDENSICLQEFVYGQKNPYTRLAMEGAYMPPQLVEHAAWQTGCRNVKAFDMKRPDLEYHEECNHQFCIE